MMVFKDFKSEDWIIWLDKAIKHKIVQPLLDDPYSPLDRRLVLLKNNLESDKIPIDGLADAVIGLINQYSRTQNNEEHLYYLLQFVGLIIPERHFNTLHLLFTKELLVGKFYNGIGLHSVLLNSLIKFTSSEDLSDYFFIDGISGKVLEIKLIGLNYFIYKGSSKQYFNYVFELIKSDASNTDNHEKIALAISYTMRKMLFLRKNDTEIASWWIRNSEILEDLNSHLFRLLMAGMEEWLSTENSRMKQSIQLQSLMHFCISKVEPNAEKLMSIVNQVISEDGRNAIGVQQLQITSIAYYLYNFLGFNLYSGINLKNIEGLNLNADPKAGPPSLLEITQVASRVPHVGLITEEARIEMQKAGRLELSHSEEY